MVHFVLVETCSLRQQWRHKGCRSRCGCGGRRREPRTMGIVEIWGSSSWVTWTRPLWRIASCRGRGGRSPAACPRRGWRPRRWPRGYRVTLCRGSHRLSGPHCWTNRKPETNSITLNCYSNIVFHVLQDHGDTLRAQWCKMYWCTLQDVQILKYL